MTENIFGLRSRSLEESVVLTDGFYKGYREVQNVSDSVITKIFKGCLNTKVKDVCGENLPENSFVTLNPDKENVLVTKVCNGKLINVPEQSAYGIHARNLEQVFAIDCLGNRNIPLVTVSGVAGTGKTLLALASAIHNRKQIKKQILVCRPIVPMGNDLGSLPGDIDDKVGPYMNPLFDNLDVIGEQTNGCTKAKRIIDNMLETQKIVIEPITYIRGRSFKGCYLIVDEAQNLTPHQVKTIITRAGEETKVVLVGDIEQIDTPGLDINSNGLSHVVNRMKGQKLYAHVHLIKSERSPLAELAGRLL